MAICLRLLDDRARWAAQRVFERRGDCARVLYGDVEVLERWEIADAAFVERAVMFEDVSLPGNALTEAEEYGFGDHACAVADCVSASVALARDRVVVRAVAEAESRVRL